jgi:proton-dependent oligopeptide transporter, POT family
LKPKGSETVIVDPAVTAQRIYMYFYLAVNLGSLAGVITVILEHSVGFWAAYVPPLCAFIFALLVIILGRRRYVLRKPQGSIVLDSFKAMYIGARNGWKLDAAKPINAPNVKWDNQFVDELKRALVACKVSQLFPVS